jgi:hypothetical protein
MVADLEARAKRFGLFHTPGWKVGGRFGLRYRCGVRLMFAAIGTGGDPAHQADLEAFFQELVAEEIREHEEADQDAGIIDAGPGPVGRDNSSSRKPVQSQEDRSDPTVMFPGASPEISDPPNLTVGPS